MPERCPCCYQRTPLGEPLSRWAAFSDEELQSLWYALDDVSGTARRHAVGMQAGVVAELQRRAAAPSEPPR